MRRSIPVHRPSIEAAEIEKVSQVLRSRWLGSGPLTEEFERRCAELIGTRHFLAVNTGTSALQLAVGALDPQPGDQVVVPSFTFAASIQAILAAGAKPVFCEVEPDSLLIDAADAARRINARTIAVMPVHFGGAVCDMAALESLCRKHEIHLVEDAAHAFGSRDREGTVGGASELACFSFDPIKNITCGTGGGIATDDETFAARIRLSRNLGIDRQTWQRRQAAKPWLYAISDEGHRFDMHDLNAAVGLAQLDRFEDLRVRRRRVARRYEAAFMGLPGIAAPRRRIAEECPFSYVIRVLDGNRDGLIQDLRERGVGALVHYIPNHLQPAFRPYAKPLPVTEQVYSEVLTLPLHPEMTDEETDYVIETVAELVSVRAGRRV